MASLSNFRKMASPTAPVDSLQPVRDPVQTKPLPSGPDVPSPTPIGAQTLTPTMVNTKPRTPATGTQGPGTTPVATTGPSQFPTAGSTAPYTATPTGAAGPNTSASYTATVTNPELTSYQLNQLINSNSDYMRNARQRGLEAAASRGLLNSSIASGASMRSALEAAAPIAGADAARYGSVEDQNRGFRFGEAANQNQMYRQNWLSSEEAARNFRYTDALQNNQSVRQNWLNEQSDTRNAQFQDALAENAAVRQDWLQSQQFDRQFNQTLALMPMTSSIDFWNNAMRMALEDPSVYTPDVINGLSNFNMTNLQNIIRQYLGPTGG